MAHVAYEMLVVFQAILPPPMVHEFNDALPIILG